MHFREIPFLRIFAPFCAGVILAEAAPSAVTAAWAMAGTAAFVITLRLIRKNYHPDTLFGAAIVMFFLATGYLMHITGKERLSTLDESRQMFTVRLSGYPDKKNSSSSFRAKIVNVTADSQKYSPRGSLLLYFLSDTLPSRWQPGDMLTVRITPKPAENNGNPCEFNYRRYLEGQGVRYMSFFRAGDIIEYQPASRLTLRERSLVVAHSMILAFEKAGLQGEELGLVTAFTIGDKDLIDKEQLTAFSRSGAMHIMAVSGLHVGMISLGLLVHALFPARKIQVHEGCHHHYGTMGFCLYYRYVTIGAAGHNNVHLSPGWHAHAPSCPGHEQSACLRFYPYCCQAVRDL